MNSSDTRTCMGYLCGAAICVTMLILDGEVAIMTGAGCAMAMFGSQAYVNAKVRALRP